MTCASRAFLAFATASVLLFGCGSASSAAVTTARPVAPASARAADDLAALSDEFDNPNSLAAWTELSAAEGSQNWIEQIDIGKTNPGELYLTPYVSGWFADWRGVYLFKEVQGDFDVTTRIAVTGRSSPVPDKSYSLAGLMARAPRATRIADWQPGKENWLFITTGYGDPSKGVGKPQFETKTTFNSESKLRLTPSQTGWVELRMIRLGSRFFTFHRFGPGPWEVGDFYVRPDLPATLQLGLNAYTDWGPVEAQDPRTFNTNPARLRGDLVVRDDYIRFRRPNLTLKNPSPTGVDVQGAINTTA